MQFHLNGFRPGDPHVFEADLRHQGAGTADGLPKQVDVQIVGCGPTGLTLAAQLAAFPDITTRIVEQKSGRLLVGQADGIACRTMEMFEAFGIADRVMQEVCWVSEFSFWKPDETGRRALIRSNRIQDVEDSFSEFPHVVFNQARVHDFYLDAMHNAPTRRRSIRTIWRPRPTSKTSSRASSRCTDHGNPADAAFYYLGVSSRALRPRPTSSSWSMRGGAAAPSITRPAPVRWGSTRWRWSIPNCGCKAS